MASGGAVMRSPNQQRKSEAPVSQEEFINAVGQTTAEVVAEKNKDQTEIVKHKGKEYTLASVQPEQPKRYRATAGAKKHWVKHVDTGELRKENVNGTAINVPFFVEDYRALEAAFELDKQNYRSFANFVRQALLQHAKDKLGDVKFDEITSEKIDQIMVQPE